MAPGPQVNERCKRKFCLRAPGRFVWSRVWWISLFAFMKATSVPQHAAALPVRKCGNCISEYCYPDVVPGPGCGLEMQSLRPRPNSSNYLMCGEHFLNQTHSLRSLRLRTWSVGRDHNSPGLSFLPPSGCRT